MKQLLARTVVTAAVACLGFEGQAAATPIVINTAGGTPLGPTTYLGQSVTTPVGPGWNSIEFAFLDGLSPVANGNLYLLTSAYLGAPSDLSAATPGYVATSTGIMGGFWAFNTSILLNPSTTYWFYADAPFAPGSMTGNGNVYAGGEIYANSLNGGGFGDNFIAHSSEDADFQLNGAPVPEPATMLLLGSGLLGLAARRRRS